MGSRVIQTRGNGPHTEMGKVEERTWTTIAAEKNGVVQEESIGQRRMTRRVHYAFQYEILEWIMNHEDEGWTRSHGPTPCATRFFGLTDSPSNCWSAEVYREVTDG